MPSTSDPLDYTDDEWRQITAGARPLQGLSANQGMTLHRHWMWANAARDWFDQKLGERDKTLAFEVQLGDEASAAMYVWYGLLWSVIEGTRARRINLGTPMSTDIRQIGEALRDARNAAFHVGPVDQNWDTRLFEILRDPAAPIIVRR